MTHILNIHEACREGNLVTLEELLSRDTSQLNSRNTDSRTPVMVAAQHGSAETFDFLVSKGSDLSKVDSKGNTLLHIACSGGNAHIVEDILSRDGSCIDSRGLHGKTPVIVAAMEGKREVFFLLLDRGCALTIADRSGKVILHWACYGGSVEIVEYLLAQDNVDTDVKSSNGGTPVMHAARRGHWHVFDILVNRGCDLSLLDVFSRNILHHACFGGNVEIVEFLLSKGNIDINKRNINGFTPAMVAALKGYENIFYLLVSKGCDLSPGLDKQSGMLQQACFGGSIGIVDFLLLNEMADMNARGQFGVTPAMLAALKAREDVFELLVDRGCDLAMKDESGDNVLHHACRSGSAAVVECILAENKSDVDCRGRNSLTPVMIAAERAHRDVFYILVAQGCDLAGVSRLGDNILHCACIGGNVEIVEYILAQEVSHIDCRGQLGSTPVMIAAQKARAEVFGILVNKGCDLTLKDRNNDSLLHHACTGGSVQIVSYLLSRGLYYINSLGQGGMTPVMMAAYSGQKDVFKFLVEENCDTTVLSAQHLSVLHVACLSGVVDIVESLTSDNGLVSLRGGEHGRTPLMMAAFKGHKLVFDYLVSKGGDLKTVDHDGNNILHLSAIGGNVDIVDFILFQNVVDINSRGQFLRTPVMMAAESGQLEVFKLLVRRECDISVLDINNNSILHAAAVGGNRKIVEYTLSQNMRNVNSRGEDGKTAARFALENGHKELAKFLESNQFTRDVSQPAQTKKYV